MDGYFHRVHRQTGTRFWINNPTGEEIGRAIEAGAVSCTTNPAYCSRLLAAEPGYVNAVIDGVTSRTADTEEAAPAVYRECSARIVESFLPLFQESGGASGFVTLQGDPREENDAQAIVRFARGCRKLGPNAMAKIPVIPAGLDAIEECVAMDMPICATEVFSLAQAVDVCERYTKAVNREGKHPPIYVTHITGIFEEYLRKAAARDGTPVPEELISQAGAAVARRQYRLLRERGYGVTMLGGGARSTSHFTDFVGADMHITINWSTAAELIGSAPPVEPRIEVETPPAVIERLSALCPDFDRAYREDGLAPEEFSDYGPVRLFRNMFLEGWYNLLAAILLRQARALR